MPISDGMTEGRAKGADTSLRRTKVVAFPYRRMREKTPGPGVLLEPMEGLLQAVEDMALLNAALSELRDLALSANEILEGVGQTIQATLVENACAKDYIPKQHNTQQ